MTAKDSSHKTSNISSMNNIFNLHRLGNFIKWSIAIDKPYNRQTAMTFLAICAILLQYPNIFYLSGESGGMKMALSMTVILITVAILVGGSYMFYSFYKFRDGIRAMFLIPASNLEKFLVRYLLPIIFALILIIISLLAGDVLQYFVGMMIDRDPLQFVFVELFNQLNKPAGTITCSTGTLLSFMFWIHTLFLLGANLFRSIKFNWVFIMLFLLLVFIGTSMLFPAMGQALVRVFQDHLNHYHTIYSLIFLIVGILNIRLSYKLFCNRQLIGKFINRL